MSNGWRAHPGAADDRPAAPPATPGRVVGVGALCELRPPRPGDHAETRSFTVSEFVTLADGRRVILHPTTATAADVIVDMEITRPPRRLVAIPTLSPSACIQSVRAGDGSAIQPLNWGKFGILIGRPDVCSGESVSSDQRRRLHRRARCSSRSTKSRQRVVVS